MDAINQVLQQLSPSNYTTPILGGIRKFNAQTFGTPSYANPQLSEQQRNFELVQSMSPMGVTSAAEKGAVRISPQVIKRAAQMLRGNAGRVHPDDVAQIGKFAEMVESNKFRGNLGETGQTIQSLIESLFGKQNAAMDNRQAKEVLDQVLKKAMGGMNG